MTETAENDRRVAPREMLRRLYYGSSPPAQRFRYGLLAFDIFTLGFVVATSFGPPAPAAILLGYVLGLAILGDFLARLWIAPRKLAYLFTLSTLADLVATLAFLVPMVLADLAFLRVLRTLRLLRTYQLMQRLRRDFPGLRENEQAILAGVNLVVFIFVMTGLIFATQHKINEQINNYADALYFTVTTLTTTGFGDITLTGTDGRLLAVAVMIVGVTLFLRLAQVLFRPPKVEHTCETCGLTLHDPDAIHCKHCGATIDIRTEGAI